jgi:hypothetical protein
MPINRELRQHYGKEWRTVTRPRILARAGDRCEFCRKPNHAIVEWFKIAGVMYWRLPENLLQPAKPHAMPPAPWIGETGQARPLVDPPPLRWIEVVITIAHLNHTPGDDRDENLAALCQYCHLKHDREHHHESRARRKDAARPIIIESLRESA